jgi:hypothetical protein
MLVECLAITSVSLDIFMETIQVYVLFKKNAIPAARRELFYHTPLRAPL